METTVKKFSELGLQSKLSGEKIEIEQIFNKEILVTGYKITPSKHNSGRCLTLQFEFEGKTRVIFTASEVMMKDLEQMQPFQKFETIITKETGSSKTWFKFN